MRAPIHPRRPEVPLPAICPARTPPRPRLGRQTNQVKVKPARQRAAVGSRRWFETHLAQALADQPINRILARWRHRLDRRHVSPVLFILGPGPNPTPQQFFLSGRKGLVRLRRRHRILLVKAKDAVDQLAFLRFARNDGAFGDRIFPDIQAELSFARLLVGAVTMKAIIGEDRPDISIVTDRFPPPRPETPGKARDTRSQRREGILAFPCRNKNSA